MITLPKPPHPSRASTGCGVEDEVELGDFALADDDEIDTGVDGWTFRWAGYPVDAARIVQLLRRGGRRVAEVRVGRPDHASDPIDLVTSATFVYSPELTSCDVRYVVDDADIERA
jgi:hypothetical protein